jgi:hypothetical protein
MTATLADDPEIPHDDHAAVGGPCDVVEQERCAAGRSGHPQLP